MASAANSAVLEADDRVLVIERVFDAPRQMVWDAFTDPKHLRNWMGPKEFPAQTYEAAVYPGGKWRAKLVSPDGKGELGQSGDTMAQVRFAICEEMALTLEDVAMRRTSLGQFGPPRHLAKVADTMGAMLGWEMSPD